LFCLPASTRPLREEGPEDLSRTCADNTAKSNFGVLSKQKTTQAVNGKIGA
jgi:hypothetical protein